MTTKKKLILAAGVVVAIGSIAGYSIVQRNRGITTVQAGKVIRQDLTQSVAANGEIKPKKYVNVSANMMGRIVQLAVKEGDRVKEGDLLLRLESIQTEADVRAAEATLEAAQTEIEGMSASIRSSEAAVASARAEITRSEADVNRAKVNFDRTERGYKEGVLSREMFDRVKSDLEIANAQLLSVRARLAQAEAQTAQVLKQRESTSLRIAQQRSALVRARDQFSKTTIRATLDGVITYLPVNEGETAVVGVQNSPGTVLMTIADMSVITAEVRVDETDIVDVKVGQEAKVKVDALGDRELMGHVSEVGNSALSRSGTGAPTTNTSAAQQEAKDFKVVITLDNPPPELRPGLSSTATIVTATRKQALSVPIQAVTIREFDPNEKTVTTSSGGSGVALASSQEVVKTDAKDKKKIEKEGVFVLKDMVALFREIKTGITGTTDIEILEGLTEGEEIVTGPYQMLRTLKDNTKVKLETPVTEQ